MEPPIQWVQGALHTGQKQANHAHLRNATVKNGSNHTSTPPYVHEAMLSYACRKFNLFDQCPDICEQWPNVLQKSCDCLKPGGNYKCTAMFSTKNSAFNHKFIYAFRLTLTINGDYSNIMQICFIFKLAVHDSGGQSPTSHCGGPGSMSGLSTWDLLRIKKGRGRFLFEVVGFPLSWFVWDCTPSWR